MTPEAEAIGIAPNDLQSIANRVTAGLDCAGEINSLELPTHQQIAVERPEIAGPVLPAAIDRIVDTRRRSPLRAGEIDSHTEHSVGALNAMFEA